MLVQNGTIYNLLLHFQIITHKLKILHFINDFLISETFIIVHIRILNISTIIRSFLRDILLFHIKVHMEACNDIAILYEKYIDIASINKLLLILFESSSPNQLV